MPEATLATHMILTNEYKLLTGLIASTPPTHPLNSVYAGQLRRVKRDLTRWRKIERSHRRAQERARAMKRKRARQGLVEMWTEKLEELGPQQYSWDAGAKAVGVVLWAMIMAVVWAGIILALIIVSPVMCPALLILGLMIIIPRHIYRIHEARQLKRQSAAFPAYFRIHHTSPPSSVYPNTPRTSSLAEHTIAALKAVYGAIMMRGSRKMHGADMAEIDGEDVDYMKPEAV